jgi:hypothetical protein
MLGAAKVAASMAKKAMRKTIAPCPFISQLPRFNDTNVVVQ